MDSPALTPTQPTAPAAAAPSTWRARLFAALIHLSASVLLIGLLAAGMWFALYPPPYFWIDGGWSVLRILILVDVILGPILTFVVFNRAKREWKRDLAIIAAVQVLAFAYGAYTMERYRPAFAAYVDNVFFAVPWPRVELGTRDLAKPRALRAGRWAPTLVVIDMPQDVQAAQALRSRSNPDGNRTLPGMGDLYLPFDAANASRVFGNTADIEALARSDPSIAAELARVRAAHPGPLTRYAFVPLAGRDEIVMAVFDRETRKMIDWMR